MNSQLLPRALVEGAKSGAVTLLRSATAIVSSLPQRGARPSRGRLSPWAAIRDQQWRLLVGVTTVLAPAVLLALLGPSVPVTTPGVLLLVAVAFSTYLADWVGGVTALVLSTIVLDVFFVGDRSFASAPKDAVEAVGYVATVASSAGLVWLIQWIKHESQIDRQAAIAARAAATALTSIEIAAASHAQGSAANRNSLNEALLRSMVTINRAHVGMLFFASGDAAGLTLGATYGLGAYDAPDITSDSAVAFADHVAAERRSRTFTDFGAEPAFKQSGLADANVRSLLGVPLIDGDDRLLGVVLVGLFVSHQFTKTELARLEAIANRTAAVLQAAVGIDLRETALNSAREAKRWLELVIAAMPEAVVLAAPPDGKVIAENQAAISLLGFSIDPEDRTSIADRLFLPDGSVPPESELPIQTALRTGEIVLGMELVVRHASGLETPVLVSAAPVKELNGPIVAVVAVFRDIAELKEASRLKDEFVSVVSHELRSPLTPIRGFVQLVAKDLTREGGHESHVNRLNSIAGHVDRMTRLVDDLLDVSRLKSGSLEIRNAPTDLLELCREVVRDRSTTSPGCRVILEATGQSIVGDWDSDRLYQVIDNLVGNAAKYSPPDGTITLRVGEEARSGEAVFSVSDEGPGIHGEDRERVFSAFYRTRDAASSQIAGLGLGLFICHELVVAHGGVIEVGESQSGGAAFTVRLPRISQAAAA